MRNDIIDLLIRQLEGSELSGQELVLLDEWKKSAGSNQDVFQLISGKESVKQALQQREAYAGTQENNWEKLLGYIHKPEADLKKGRKAYFIPRRWTGYAAAVILIAAMGVWFFFKDQQPVNTVVTNHNPSLPDISPGGNKAILTLADGSTIILDSAANGSLADQGNTKIIKLDAGSLAYRGQGSVAGQVTGYNTITTPRGGQYQVLLPDGSKVWLNASSSVTFPTPFAANARNVEVKGEVYFEVKSGASMPFTVSVNGMDVHVLGTAFNINAYPDEESIKTTLMEGRVQVSAYRQLRTLTPGQQAVVKAMQPGSQKGSIEVMTASADKVLAWKNGLFNFENKTLQQAMRQLARWYDLEIVYPQKIPAISFGGEIGRDFNLSEVLKALESTGLRFTIESNRRLVIR